MMKQALVLASVLALGACANNRSNIAQDANPQGSPRYVDDERLIGDPALDARVGMTNIVEGETPGGLRRVQAELFNGTNKFQQIRYRFTWTDGDGLTVNSPANTWTTVGVSAGDYTTIQGIAPTQEAVDFRLSWRDAK